VCQRGTVSYADLYSVLFVHRRTFGNPAFAPQEAVVFQYVVFGWEELGARLQYSMDEVCGA